MPEPGSFRFIIGEQEAGTRLDRCIVHHISDCSRSFAARLIQEGCVRVNRLKKKPSYQVHDNDIIAVEIPVPEKISAAPEPIPLDILYEDRDLIVISKPAGMVVHPAPGHYSGTLVHGLLHHCQNLEGIGGEIRPGIVHRLDKDTSGVMVVAKSEKAHHSLTNQFKNRQVKKCYLALVHGVMGSDAGAIDQPIGRHPVQRKKMSTASRHSREAYTDWQVVRCFEMCAVSLLSVQIKTGRTHQIRVHLSAIGHPLLGDPVYGSRKLDANLRIRYGTSVDLNRQMLHANRLQFSHPITGKLLTVKSALPKDMDELVQFLDALKEKDR